MSVTSDALAEWHVSVMGQCEAALQSDRLPHALILNGSAGWGIERLARRIALSIIGRSDFAGDIAEFAHPDFRWIVPEGKGEQIKIDAVRALAEFAVQTPQMSSRKVAVVLQADAMNENAANALLKTLEEPPPGTHLLLVTSSLADLLPTIRSRCQRLDLATGGRQSALAWVAQQIDGVDTAELDLTAFELSYAPERILDALRNGRSTVAPVLRGAMRSDVPILRLAEGAAQFGTEEFIGRAMRHILAGLALRHAAVAAPDAIASALTNVPLRGVHELWDAHIAAQALVRGTTNPNPKLLIEDLLLRWRAASRAA